METRMERYSKYRAQIRAMADADFPVPSQQRQEKPRVAITPESATSAVTDFVGADNATDKHNGAYLRRKKRLLIAKIVLGILLLAATIIAAILLFF